MALQSLAAQYRLTDADLDRVREHGKSVTPRLDVFIEKFYDWMRTIPEFGQFFSSPQKLSAVQNLQRDYWNQFFSGRVDDEYFGHRKQVGETHARIGLSLPAYFAAMDVSLHLWTREIPGAPVANDTYESIVKLCHVDTAIVVDTFSQRTTAIIRDQHEAMMEMSTPVTEVWEDVLMLPIVGMIDSHRAQDIMTAVLTKIGETHARSLILDISGVAVMDTAVANHLIKISKASGLMGSTCIISGVSPSIAQTVVELGIDVGGVRTTATLRDALTVALRDAGVEIQAQRR
jgi:rsbT co-antagonist protein RsbR